MTDEIRPRGVGSGWGRGAKSKMTSDDATRLGREG